MAEKSKKEILAQIKERQVAVDRGTALLTRFEQGRHLFASLSDADLVCRKLIEDIHFLRTLLWVIGEDEA